MVSTDLARPDKSDAFFGFAIGMIFEKVAIFYLRNDLQPLMTSIIGSGRVTTEIGPVLCSHLPYLSFCSVLFTFEIVPNLITSCYTHSIHLLYLMSSATDVSSQLPIEEVAD